MERTKIFDLMGELKLYGMKTAFEEVIVTAIKRQHEPQRIVGDLLTAKINEKQARSIKYQLTIAKLLLAKDIDDFQFDRTPINQTLVNDLAGGGFIAQQHNVVLVGGTGTGKTIWPLRSRKVASAMVPGDASTTSSISSIGSRSRPAMVGKADSPNIRRAWTSSFSTNWVICRSRNPAASSRSTSSAGFASAPPSSSAISHSANGRACSAMPNDHSAPRELDSSLGHRRDRQRQLALQKPRRCSNNPRSRRLRNPDQLRRRERYQQSTPIKGVPFGL